MALREGKNNSNTTVLIIAMQYELLFSPHCRKNVWNYWFLVGFWQKQTKDKDIFISRIIWLWPCFRVLPLVRLYWQGPYSPVTRGGSGGGNRGQYPHDFESGTPCGPTDRESALIIQWQISCNDFVLKGKAEIKCLSSLLPKINCWNCKHCFVWMSDLSFFLGCMCPLTKKTAPTWPPY